MPSYVTEQQSWPTTRKAMQTRPALWARTVPPGSKGSRKPRRSDHPCKSSTLAASAGWLICSLILGYALSQIQAAGLLYNNLADGTANFLRAFSDNVHADDV
jgi:hypothetical protein